MFGSNSSTTPLFGQGNSTPATTTATTTSTTTPATSTAPKTFGFGAPATPGATSTLPTATSKPLFGGASSSPAPTASKPSFGGFSTTAAPSTTSTGFSFGAKPEDKKEETKPTTGLSFGAGSSAAPSKSTGLSFGGASTATPAAKPSGFSLGGLGSKPEEKKDETKPATGFSFGAGSTTTPAKPAGLSFGTGSTATKPTGLSFGAKPEEKKDDAKPTTGFSLSGLGGKTEEKKEETKPAGGFSLGAKTDDKKDETKPADKKVSFEVSTTTAEDKKVPVKIEDFKPQQLSIMNKNMEDLITKWTNQLTLSSKTFESYSDKIGEWDKILVESSDKVSKLYNDTLQAEQKQEKIDQTLAYIEKQQDELDKVLSGYERQSDKLLSSIEKSTPSNSSSINNKETNDEAREKAYKLAEMLENRLDSLGTNFSSLVNEVNEVSDNFNRSLLNTDATETNEQTLNDVLKLLNNHMESLSWIAENEKQLKEKLEKLSGSVSK